MLKLATTVGWALITAAYCMTSTAPAAADGTWLDQPLTSWNTPGGDVPAAPPAVAAINPRCAGSHRPAETDEDAAITSAGWTLFAAYQSGWGLRIVQGMVGQDGMCRPLGYQAFVFVNGIFAGAVSPLPMDSRTDGALSSAIISPTGDRVQARFSRYADTDPLCCPSRVSSVEFHINTDGGAPVLEPGAVYTSPGGT